MADHDDRNGKGSDTTTGPRVTPLGGNTGVHIASAQADEALDIDFGGFIVSLGTSCMVNLGKYPNPETGKLELDLDAARQVIHILQMLAEKTRGNLEDDESQLLRTLIYDLKLAYVEVKG
ncbi:DUF1844 domain-containing protein [Lujinxingia vulgaris]|uniref:DUF1844 domain-containing protein n=1 Tax=Lujinxingia vulgaris TaxID=2600176 RepID=A0A5C6X425_9DELT|nr:DUF1844 domain-containing protein [Lujinxingia vulgaris]TXD33838.1 DUF1844 domain-containing protein [Lujinxingia vulgaris]